MGNSNGSLGVSCGLWGSMEESGDQENPLFECVSQSFFL